MADLKKPRYVTYADADPALRSEMDAILKELDDNPESREAAVAFGAPQIKLYKQAVRDLEEFLADPTSPEAPPERKENLRQQYLKAAQGVSLVLGAGGELLRRYEEEYIPEATRAAAFTGSTAHGNYLDGITRRRQELLNRIVEIELPEKTNDFVQGAILRIEAARAFERSLKEGLPLEQDITVRKSPLKLLRQEMRT